MGLCDDEIARLEAELAEDDESSDDGSSSGGDDDDEDEDDVAPAVVADGVLASLREERIAPLPSHLLPQVSEKKRAAADRAAGGGAAAAKRPRHGPEAAFAAAAPAVVAEARKLVAAAARSEKVKLPFACRLCAFKGPSLEAFDAHRETELHKVATKVWKDESYCKMCRSQCTSPNELEIHLKSKKHLERLAELRAGKNLHVPRGATGASRNQNWRGAGSRASQFATG